MNNYPIPQRISLSANTVKFLVPEYGKISVLATPKNSLSELPSWLFNSDGNNSALPNRALTTAIIAGGGVAVLGIVMYLMAKKAMK